MSNTEIHFLITPTEKKNETKIHNSCKVVWLLTVIDLIKETILPFDGFLQRLVVFVCFIALLLDFLDFRSY